MGKRFGMLVLCGLCAAVPGFGPSPAAAAQDGPLSRADRDGDGVVSEREWMDAAKARFDKLDANHDGRLSQDEIQQARDSLRERFRSRWEQRRGGATAP
ncbi:MAG: hypothetical protein ACOY6E_13040 [Pseudomonadota bacterium]